MKKILNLIKNPKVKMVIILSFLIFAYTSICAFSYAQTVSQELSDSVFRLHVIANSNSTEDQNLKYIVRDNLIKYMNNICGNCSNKEDAIKLVNENIPNFQKIAEDTIKQNGFNYPVSIEIGNFEFPTKTYGDISLPAGYYDALKVQIGEVSIIYAHCNNIYVKQGDKLTQGQEIAEVGSTGNSTGPHLHFEIRIHERTVNPQSILEL